MTNQTKPTWEHCNCGIDLSSPDPVHSPCGCGNKDCQVRTYRDDAVHWKGKHWRISCAFAAALNQSLIIYEQDPSTGTFIVTSPLLPELLTQGKTTEEVLTNSIDALNTVLAHYRQANQPLPELLSQDSSTSQSPPP